MNKGCSWYVVCICFAIFISLLSQTHNALGNEGYVQELMKQGTKAYENGNYEEAIRLFKEAALKYNSASATLNLGIIYDKELHYKAKAKYFYKKFLKSEPHAREADMLNSRLYILHEGLDTPESHKAAFKEESLKIPIITVGKKLDGYTIQGNEYFKEGNFLKAIIEYRKAIVLEKSGIGCFNIAVLYYEHLRFKAKALFFFKRYITLGKNENLKSIASKMVTLIQQNKTRKKVLTSPVLKLRTTP